MFHRVKTSPSAQEQESVTETPQVVQSESTSTSPANNSFVKSQVSSGKTPSYLQPSETSAQNAAQSASDDIEVASSKNEAPASTSTKTTIQTQQKEKDTETMPENSSIVSQTTPYQSPEKGQETKASSSSLYAAEAKPSAAPGGYAPSYSSPYAKQSAASTNESYASSDRKLTIGRGITMSGEIESCDHLYVEGTVEAALKGAEILDIAESGIFYGTVDIENANVAGRFEGDLTVKGRLVVEATGVVTGSITYGELQIESGAIIDGRLTPMAAAPVTKSVRPAAAAAPQKQQAAPQETNEPQQVQQQSQGKSLFEKQSVVSAE